MGKYTDHHWVHQNSEEAANLIEQLQQRNAELETQVRSIALSREELSATVERLRGVMTKFERSYEELEYDGNVGVFFESDALDELSEALEETPQQNLNAVKREAYSEGYYDGYAEQF